MTVTQRKALLNQVDRLERQAAEVAAVAARTDDDRGRDLIQLRRELADCMARAGELGEQYYRSHADQSHLTEFRNLFSAMRAKIAAHQANWPAFKMREAGDDYRRSIQVVDEAFKAFIAWVRKHP